MIFVRRYLLQTILALLVLFGINSKAQAATPYPAFSSSTSMIEDTSFTFRTLDGLFASSALNRLFVLDSGNKKLKIYNLAMGFVSQFSITSPNSGGMRDVEVDAVGDIYIGDTNNVRKFDQSGNLLKVFGTGNSGVAPGDLYQVTAIAVSTSTGRVYVADESPTAEIIIFNSDGTYRGKFGGLGASPGQFGSVVYSIAIDPAGNIWVADPYNTVPKLQKFDPDGVFISEFTNDDLFAGPVAISFDTFGNMYVLDGSMELYEFDTNLTIIRSLIATSAEFIAVDDSGNLFYLNNSQYLKQIVRAYNFTTIGNSVTTSSGGRFGLDPRSSGGIVIDALDRLYTVDDGMRVDVFNSSGVQTAQYAGYGNTNGKLRSGDHGAGLNIAASSTLGFMYIPDVNASRVVKLSITGTYSANIGSSGSTDGKFVNPKGVAIDPSGNLFVADTGNNRIQKFNSSNVYQSQFGSAGSGPGQFSNPENIFIDPSGFIFVTDTNNHRIQKFTSSGVYVSQFGTGSSGSGDGVLNSPRAAVTDSFGNVWVADAGNHRIVKFNSAGVFQFNFGSSGTGDTQFNFPRSLAFDSSGKLFVSDWLNNRIQSFVFPTASTTVSSNSVSVTEGGQGSYSISLNAMPTGDVTITPSTNSRIALSPSVLTFTSSNFNTPQTVTVTSVRDYNVTGELSIPVSYSITSSDTDFNNTNIATTTITITDVDTHTTLNVTPSSRSINRVQSFLSFNGSPVIVSPPSAMSVRTITNNLKIGSSNVDVLKLQKFLNSQGYFVAKTGPGSPGRETLYFGPATRAALIKYQKANKIPATGFFGPLTRKSLGGE